MRTKRIHWNIGLIVFVGLFLYMLIHVFIYLGKDKISVYKVTEDRVSKAYSFTGIAIRDENLIKTEQGGYITYYVNEGKRIVKNGVLFVVDADGKVQKELSNQKESENKGLTNSEQEKILTALSEYTSVKSDDSYHAVYDLKNELKGTLLSMNEGSINKIISSMNQNGSSFLTQKSDASGVSAFYSDNFDGKTIDDITVADFNQEKYRTQTYHSSSKVKKGDVVARIVKNEIWNLVIPLSKEQYTQLKSKEDSGVSILFTEDDVRSSAKIQLQKKGKNYFAYLTLNDYCVRYLANRYIDFDIILEAFKGYKIPDSAIVKKSFYQVPLKYITKGNNSDEEGFTVRLQSKSGESKVEQKNFKIYKKDKKYCYLDPNEVEEGTTFMAMKGGSNYTVNKMKTIKGVYCTNQGYADFRVIQEIAKEGNYTIIEPDTKNGIDCYDFIVLDSNTMKENQIIY